MRNLLCACFSRLWKETIFWTAWIFMAAAGFFFTAFHYCIYPESPYTPEEFCFNFHWLIGVVSAIICCLFLGREFQDGGLRNKLIAGHSRWKVYLSGLMVNIAASVLLALGYFLAACLCGMPVFGGFVVSPGEVMLLILSCALSVAVYASLFTMIQMLTGSRVISLILSILLALGLYLLAQQINGILYVPALLFDGGPNPRYPGEGVHGFLEVLFEILPSGQGMILSLYTLPYIPIQNIPYGLLPCYSGMLIALTTGAGLWGFSKKNLH